MAESEEVASQDVSTEDKIANIFGEAPVEEPPESQEEEVEAQEEEDSAEVTEDEAEESDDPWAELDFDGVPVYVGKDAHEKVRDALMRTADYTQKTTELASQRRALELQQRVIQETQQAQQFQESVSEELQQLAMLNSQIGKFDDLNWRQMDRDERLDHLQELDLLERQQRKLQESLQSKQSEWQRQQEEAHQKYLQESSDYLSKEIRGWNQETANEVAQYALKQGYTDAQINSPFISPVDVKVLWKAMRFDQLQAQTKDAKKKASKAPPIPKPGATQQMNRKKGEFLRYRKALKQAREKGSHAVEGVMQERIAQKYGL